MNLGQDTLEIIAVAAAAVAAVSFLYVLVLGRRVRKMRRAFRGRQASTEARGDQEATEMLGLEVAGLREDTYTLQEAIARSVQRVGIIRFDAFEDMGGMLSFAVALLDADGNGVVLSSINGRNETRIYAKAIEQGTSKTHLSGEEEEAIRRALGAVRR